MIEPFYRTILLEWSSLHAQVTFLNFLWEPDTLVSIINFFFNFTPLSERVAEILARPTMRPHFFEHLDTIQKLWARFRALGGKSEILSKYCLIASVRTNGAVRKNHRKQPHQFKKKKTAASSIPNSDRSLELIRESSARETALFQLFRTSSSRVVLSVYCTCERNK